MANIRLLLAEDERELSRALSAILEHEGYYVDAVYDGEEATEKIEANVYDMIILDIMMPKKDGIEVLRDLRSGGNVTPVLMLTAKSEVENRVEGLDAGADDYLTKPFAMKELLARITVQLRRRNESDESSISSGELTLINDAMTIR